MSQLANNEIGQKFQLVFLSSSRTRYWYRMVRYYFLYEFKKLSKSGQSIILFQIISRSLVRARTGIVPGTVQKKLANLMSEFSRSD